MLLKKYDKKLDFSYTYGVAPTLDLLRKMPELVSVVLIHPDGESGGGVQELKKLCANKGLRWELAPRAIKSISAKENTYAIGVFKKYQSKIESNSNHVVLVNPSNPGNLGTILRSMAGFDFKNLAIIRPATDIFDPKVVRSSMGSIFDINFEYFDSFEEYQARFADRCIYTFTLNGSKNIQDVTFVEPYSLVFGKESSGLKENVSSVGTGVYIPCSKNIDSLNLSVAVSIALYSSSIFQTLGECYD